MNEELKSRLLGLGVTEEQIGKLTEQGLTELSQMVTVTEADLLEVGVAKFKARAIVAAFAPVPVAAVPNPVEQVIPEGAQPTSAQVNAFANQFGMEPNLVSTILMGQMMAGTTGMPMNFAGLIPVAQILPSYSPRKRDIAYLFMSQLEEALVDRKAGEGIIVINNDGSINREYTAQHIQNIDENQFPYPDDGFYYDDAGQPHQIVQVGVDAQAYMPADPLDIELALQANMRGKEGIRYKGTDLSVRQAIYWAHQLGELNTDNWEIKTQWLRHNVNASTQVSDLASEFPKAVAKWHEHDRSKSNPQLIVMNSRKPRKEEIMPRRKRLPYKGEGLPGTGSGFPSFDDER